MLIIYLFHLLFCFAGQNNPTSSHPVNRWAIDGNSTLNIEGKSNITSFRCDITRYLHVDTLDYFKNEATRQFIFNNGSLTIDINCFDCHQRFITNDFRKTLKADQNNLLKIQFLSMDAFDPRCRQAVKGKVAIVLAGITKTTMVDFVANPTTNGLIQLNGEKTLQFSDFNLTPPRKLAGFIRIEEEIKVSFQLFFKIV